MAKNALYCSHDSNARNDEKIIALRMKHDWKGYGLYWAIIEKLREATCYKLSADYNLIAYDLRTDAGLIKSIINDFGLFSFSDNGECFYSKSLLERMSWMDAKSLKATDAVKQRWEREKAKNDTNVLRTYYDGNTIKESKVNKEDEEERKKEPSPTFLNSSSLIGFSKAEKELTLSGQFGEYAQKQTLKTIPDLEKLKADFLTEQNAVGKISWPDIADLRKHFINWVKKKPKPTGGVYTAPKNNFIDHSKPKQNAY